MSEPELMLMAILGPVNYFRSKGGNNSLLIKKCEYKILQNPNYFYL